MKRLASTSKLVLAIAAAISSMLPHWIGDTLLASTLSSTTVQAETHSPALPPKAVDESRSNSAPSTMSLSASLSTAPIFRETLLAPAAEAYPAPPPEIRIEPLEGLPPDFELVESRKVVWYMPWTLIPLDGWANSVEVGINGSSGNANSFSFQTGARFKRKTDEHLFDIRMTHNRTETNGVEKQNNALLYGDYDRYFDDSPASLFMKQGVEHDRFKAFDLRYNISAGVAYRFIKSEPFNLKGRFGSGTSREFGGSQDRWVAEALFGSDVDYQWNKSNKFVARFDYFPEWKDFSNYRIVSDASWEMLWDQMGNLSFKIGAIDRYDSTPGGRKPNDLTYSMLLLYKF